VSKNPKAPSCTVFLNPELETSKHTVEKIAKGMKRVLLLEIVSRKDVLYDPDEIVCEEDKGMIRRYRLLNAPDKRSLAWVCRVHLDKQKMLELALTMKDVVRAVRIFTLDKAEVIASEEGETHRVIRIRPFQIKTLKKCMDRVEDEAELKSLEEMMVCDMVDMVVESCRISGLAAIRNTFTVSKNKQYHIETDGTTFQEILASGSAVDSSRTQSNSIQDNLYFLGVSASVTVLFREAHDVLTEGGSNINPRHLELLALKMAYSGVPIPVTRHGMAKAKHSVLLRASFERTVDTFMEGAMHSVSDTCNGIVESIVMGQVPKMGSGFIDVLAQPTRQEGGDKKKRILDDDEQGEFVGRRKKAFPKAKRRWEEPVVYKQSWDFTMGPRRSFSLFNLKYTCKYQQNEEVFTPPPEASGWGSIPKSPSYNPFYPTSPTYNPNGPTTPNYDPNAPASPEYDPNKVYSPVYDPNAPKTPSPEPNSTPPYTQPRTPPFMARNHGVETPPETPPVTHSPQFTTTPLWHNGPDTPKEVTPAVNNGGGAQPGAQAEWDIVMESPHFDEDGLMPWVVNPSSPVLN
jgi:DNA-directed RNA polymerase II subunit RPB1